MVLVVGDLPVVGPNSCPLLPLRRVVLHLQHCFAVRPCVAFGRRRKAPRIQREVRVDVLTTVTMVIAAAAILNVIVKVPK